MSDDALDELAKKMPKWLAVTITTVFLCLFAAAIARTYISSKALSTDPRYTIGQVTRTDYVVGPSSHSVAFFTYSVGDSTYQTSSNGDVAEGCTRCLVKFAASDPTNFEFFNKICIPDSVRQAPAAGWFYPPFPVPSKVR